VLKKKREADDEDEEDAEEEEGDAKDGKGKKNKILSRKESTSLHLPLARVKRIMKTDPDVKYLSNEAATLITRATELFVEYFANSAYVEIAAPEGRKILQYKDLSRIVKDIECLEFLSVIIPEKKTRKQFLAEINV